MVRMSKLRLCCVAAAAALAFVPAAHAGEAQDAEMKKLADASGCLVCHGIEPGRRGPGGIAPIAPAWQDVAARYAGKPGAADFLTRVVLEGTSPYASHWKDEVSGLAMPPNAVAIKAADARKLVEWILTLKH